MADSIFKRAGEVLGFSKRGVPTQTLGTSRSTGSVVMGEGAGTFDEPDHELNLIGTRRFREFDRMVRDVAIIGAGVRLFLNLVSNAVWTVNPPEDLTDAQTKQAQDIADQAYSDLFGMTTSWSAIVKKTAMFRLQGFSIQEWTAVKRPDGGIGFLDIEHRPQRSIVRWNRDESGTVESVVQRVPGRPDVELPRSKIIYAVDDTLSDSPEGVGLFRQMAGTAARLELFLQLEEIGFSTDLRGIPIARAPLGELRKEVLDSGPEGTEARSKAEARRTGLLAPLRAFLEKHMRNEKTGVLFPSETFIATAVDKATTPTQVPKWSLELLTGDSQSFEAMAKAVDRMNQEMARLMGVEHLLLGAQGAGSLALARSKIGAFYLSVTSTLFDLLEIYDRDLLTPWAELNGVPEELRPEMGVNEISDRDVEQLLDGLSKLALAGAPVMPDDPAVGEIYDIWGLTRPPERVNEADMSLNPARHGPSDPNAPPDPNGPMTNSPEDNKPVAKVRILKARMRRLHRRPVKYTAAA